MLWNSFKIWSHTFLCSFYYLNILCPLFHQGVFHSSWKKENLSPCIPKAPEYARSTYTCTHVHAHMCTHTYICDTVLMTSQSLGTLAIFKHILHILVTDSWFPTLSHSEPMDEYHLVLVIYCTEFLELLHTFLLGDLRLCQGHSLLCCKMCPWNRNFPIVFSNKYWFKVFI